MNISCHPLYKPVAKELKRFLKEKKIALDVNYIIGGDGSLFTYASFSEPNLLISPDSSVGYYSACRIKDFKEFILDYVKDQASFNKGFMTVKVELNGKVLPDRAINEVLITEGLHKVFKSRVNGVLECNSGIMCYTVDGWKGYARNFGARQFNGLGVLAVAPFKGSLSMKGSSFKELGLIVNERHHPLLFIDCKEVNPYDKSCTSKRKVFIKPYRLKPGDFVKVSDGEQVIIVKS